MARRVLFFSLLLVLATLAACQPLSPSPDGPVPPAAHFITATPSPIALLPTVTPTPEITPTPIALDGPVTVAIDGSVPERFAVPLGALLGRTDKIDARNGPQPLSLVARVDAANTVLMLTHVDEAEHALLVRYFAVVAPFATLEDDIALETLVERWQSADGGRLYTSGEAALFLEPLLGSTQATVIEPDELVSRLAETTDSLGIVPFDHIDPSMKVLTVDGVNVLDNRLSPADYPLAAALTVQGTAAPLVKQLLRPATVAISPTRTNRDPSRLTTLIMTGVTAMSRGTAAAMERRGLTFPAQVISGTLSAADITHVSNEVPFLDDCVVNNTVNNLTLCSHTDYWATLEAIGTDIVGLSGNHVNDFGRDGARRSLAWYRENQIPIYGSGVTPEEACAPLFWAHNGNTFAFVAALAFGPSTAWVTEDEPGACYFYERKEELLQLVRDLARQVDIVSVELQYVETYAPYPTGQQVSEFRELREAGAAIVTGVQSHVPQAMEPYGDDDALGPGMIAYGLGNLFFDQMWSWETRTELMARHTLYDGRLLNSEVLTAVLEGYAQPRWAEKEERTEILTTIFGAAPDLGE